MAAVRTEESLAECKKPLEVMDAAECDGDEQRDPTPLVDDTPEKELMFLVNYVTLLYVFVSIEETYALYHLNRWLVFSIVKYYDKSKPGGK